MSVQYQLIKQNFSLSSFHFYLLLDPLVLLHLTREMVSPLASMEGWFQHPQHSSTVHTGRQNFYISNIYLTMHFKSLSDYLQSNVVLMCINRCYTILLVKNGKKTTKIEPSSQPLYIYIDLCLCVSSCMHTHYEERIRKAQNFEMFKNTKTKFYWILSKVKQSKTKATVR